MDIPSIMQLVFQQSKSYVFFALQFPRQSAGHSSCATEGRFHSAVLEQGCCRCCVRQLPMVQTVLQLRSPTRSSTSLVQNSGKCLRFSHRQSSMTISRRVWPIFRTPPKGVESRVARIFRALDDEEFVVVEGSPGWRGRRESDSQVTCHL